MGDKNKRKVIVAYSGDFMDMTILAYESPFPLLRIEGVFSKKKHFEEWAEGFEYSYEHTILYSMKLPLDPKYGDKEKGMKPYYLKTNGNFEVMEIQEIESLDEDDPRFRGNVVQATPTESGEYTVTCWARDEFDACKLAIKELRESNTEFDLENEVDPTTVAKVTIHMPTNPEVSFELPAMFGPASVGEILDINYEDFITDPDEWELAQSTLNNDVMVIDRIEENEVWLREGNPT